MEFKAPSGAKVVINPADFEAAMELKSCIMRELSKADVKMELSALAKQQDGEQKDRDIADIVKLFATMDASRDVQNAVFDCLIRCTYSGEKITRNTFEDVNARQDYYDIIFHCIKENLTPFAKSLRLWFMTMMQSLSVAKDEGQKQQ